MKNVLFLGLLLLCNAVFAQKQTPGLDILGYDVFGEYANQSSKKKYCLFKFSNYSSTPIGTELYSVPQYVVLENISNHQLKEVSGERLKEYSKSLSVEAGLQGESLFFSGSVNTSYNTSSEGSSYNYFYTYKDANTKWRISLDERVDLKEILDPIFVKDLIAYNNSDLINNHGYDVKISTYKSLIFSNNPNEAVSFFEY